MCWTNYMETPIVLKKPLRVYKVGISSILGGFISLFRDCVYYKCQAMPTVEIDPKFERIHLALYFDYFYIYKGYYSYLTEKIAKYVKNPYTKIGIFEIPAGATIYVNYRSREVVSTDIEYLGLLEE